MLTERELSPVLEEAYKFLKHTFIQAYGTASKGGVSAGTATGRTQDLLLRLQWTTTPLAEGGTGTRDPLQACGADNSFRRGEVHTTKGTPWWEDKVGTGSDGRFTERER
jgi:hypothetical protein